MNNTVIAVIVMAWYASVAGAAGVEQTPQPQGQDEGMVVAQHYDRYDRRDWRDRHPPRDWDRDHRPPPHWARERPPPPHPDAMWVPGQWERHRGIDEWVPGHWEYRHRRYPHDGYRPVR